MSDAEDGITFETRNSLLKSKSRSPATRRSKSASRSKSRSRSRSKSSRSRSRSRHSSYRRYSRSRSRSRSRRRHRSRSHSRRRRSFTNSPFSNRRRHQGDRGNPEPNTCLGVFGLSLYTTEHDLREVFGRYGPVADVNVVYDQQSGRPRGFAFVYMQNMEDSKEAKERVNGMELDGRNIRVDFSITKRAHTPTPGIYMGRPSLEGHERGGYDRGDRYDRGERGGGGGGGGYHSRGGYDRGGYDRYEERDYDHRHSHSSYGRKRSPSPYYGRGGGYHSRSRSRSYSPRRY